MLSFVFYCFEYLLYLIFFIIIIAKEYFLIFFRRAWIWRDWINRIFIDEFLFDFWLGKDVSFLNRFWVNCETFTVSKWKFFGLIFVLLKWIYILIFILHSVISFLLFNLHQNISKWRKLISTIFTAIFSNFEKHHEIFMAFDLLLFFNLICQFLHISKIFSLGMI